VFWQEGKQVCKAFVYYVNLQRQIKIKRLRYFMYSIASSSKGRARDVHSTPPPPPPPIADARYSSFDS
jgi:hypothetical protein